MSRARDRSESDFLREYDPGSFPRVAVTVDVALMTIRAGQLAILLIRRGIHPFKGH
jgi:8-oxo-dGTP diphosphatase